MKQNNMIVLGRLLPDSGKKHQNQEVYSAVGGRVKYARLKHVISKIHLRYWYIQMWLKMIMKSNEIIRLIHRGTGGNKAGFIQ